MVTANEVAVDLRGLYKSFGAGTEKAVALDGVSLQIQHNEFFTLLGPSGCGKTTLLRLIAGFESPTRGEVFLFGTPIANLPPMQRPVNTVFQQYALFPHMTVAENVAFGLQMLRRSAKDIHRTVAKTLALVQMEEFSARTPSQLSGGQQQRVALARALAPQPKVLLLDEPLSALDLKLRQQMRHELKDLQKKAGITFIFVTHDQEEALSMSDHIAVMQRGQVQQIGTPKEIYDRPENRFVADFIGDANLFTATVVQVETVGDGAMVTCKLNSGCTVKCAVDDAVAHKCKTAREVTIVARPETITLQPLQARSTAAETLSGSICEVDYLGTDTAYLIKLQNDLQVYTRIQNAVATASNRFNIGDTARVVLNERALHLIVD